MPFKQNAKRRNKRLFSLFELLLVLVLISLVGGYCSYNLPKVLRADRFEREVALLIDKLNSAQEVMIDYNCDCYVRFQPKENGILCTLLPSKPLPQPLLVALNKDGYFKEIASIQWENVSHFSLGFLAQEGKTPCGELVLKGRVERRIYLPGYVARITQKNEKKPISVRAQKNFFVA